MARQGLRVAVLVVGWLCSTAVAGPLDPPAGAISPTYKTLSDVEPRIAINATNTPGDADSLFKITQPGSYYLTENITGVVGKHGIEIAASGVSLDLNGFDLAGVPAMGAFDGVGITTIQLKNITVRNGSVRNWGDEGVDLLAFSALNCRVEGVHVSGNAGIGLSAGHNSTVAVCSAILNTGGGISTGQNCTISSCTAHQNTVNGMLVDVGCTVSNCSASWNTGFGINAANGSTVSNCSANNNTSNGINTNTGSTVSDCSAYDNSGSGISTFSGCTVSTCSAYNNSNHGIFVSNGSTVTNCSAHQNGLNGISVGGECTVADCTVRSNTLDGIRCNSACVIRGNTCAFSGSGPGDGAGIHAINFDNRIEGNNCTGADRGIDVDGAGNIIIGNTCSGNTFNWDIAANNVFGPIVDVTVPASAAVLGDSASSSLGSNHPNANFTY